MVLATRRTTTAQPSARVVLCKRLVADAGYVVFFTNYESRKGRELAAHPRAAAVFHWDALHRQVRIEGRSCARPDAESDEYFASRALDSRIGGLGKRSRASHSPRAPRWPSKCARLPKRFGIAPGATRRRRATAAALGRLSPVDRHDRAVGRRGRIASTIAPCGRARSEPAIRSRSRATGSDATESERTRAESVDRSLLHNFQCRLGALAFASPLGGALGRAPGGGCGGGASASEKIIPCPVSRA